MSKCHIVVKSHALAHMVHKRILLLQSVNLFCSWHLIEAIRLKVQSNLSKGVTVLRGHLSLAATFFGSRKPKYNANEPVLRGHLS